MRRESQRETVRPFKIYCRISKTRSWNLSPPGGVAPLSRVIVIGDRAWTFDLLRARGQVEVDDLVLTWRAGQSSALDTRRIADGTLVDTDHHITFAFVFFAFQPNGRFFQ